MDISQFSHEEEYWVGDNCRLYVDCWLAYMDDACLAISSPKDGDGTDKVLIVQYIIQAQNLSYMLGLGK